MVPCFGKKKFLCWTESTQDIFTFSLGNLFGEERKPFSILAHFIFTLLFFISKMTVFPYIYDLWEKMIHVVEKLGSWIFQRSKSQHNINRKPVNISSDSELVLFENMAKTFIALELPFNRKYEDHETLKTYCHKIKKTNNEIPSKNIYR